MILEPGDKVELKEDHKIKIEGSNGETIISMYKKRATGKVSEDGGDFVMLDMSKPTDDVETDSKIYIHKDKVGKV